jgi:gliding-associated putative ABC transporter substrate-binding component GldG
MSKRKNTAWWIGLIAGLFVINFIAAKVHTRIDLTEEKRYSITNTTRNLLRNLKNDVTINVFLTGDLPVEFRKLANSTQEFLSILKETNPSKIRYRFIDPQDEIENGKIWADTLQAIGATPINLTVQVKAGQENKMAFPYALVQSADRFDLVNLFQSSKRNISVAELNNAEALLEYQFAKTIDRINDSSKISVAFATGNGEPTGPNVFSLWHAIAPQGVPREFINPQYFDPNAKSNYELGFFDLKIQKAIPPSLNVLLIIKPTTSFTEDEKLKIDQYLMNGGKVLCFIDNLQAEQDSLSIKSQVIAYDRNLNLQDLFFSYGVRINPDLIMDLQCDFLPFAVGGSATDPQYEFLHWNYYPLFESANNHDINKNLGLVAGRFVNSVDTVEVPGVKKTFLLKSSVNSRTISSPALISPNENRNTPQDVLFNKQNIPAAVLLEGNFSSFYKGRISKPQMDSLQVIGGFKSEGNGAGKIIVVADGDIVLNDITSNGPLPMGMNLYTVATQYEYQFANRDFLLNCLEYLTGKSTIIQIRNKEIVLRLLDAQKVGAEKSQWQLINIALPIVLIIIAGIVYQQFRRYRFSNKA